MASVFSETGIASLLSGARAGLGAHVPLVALPAVIGRGEQVLLVFPQLTGLTKETMLVSKVKIWWLLAIVITVRIT